MSDIRSIMSDACVSGDHGTCNNRPADGKILVCACICHSGAYKAGVLAERERCAKIAESLYVKEASDEEFVVRREIAAKIREGK